jgi:two-component system nitrogen regulation response regulator NtrX
VRHFLAQLSQEYGRRPKTVDPAAMAALQAYVWPGNVRELRNVLERLMIMVPGDVITLDHVGFPGSVANATLTTDTFEGEALSLHDARERFERDYIARVWAAQQGNMSRTAEVLGVERSNLYRKMKGFGLLPTRRGETDDEAREPVR